MKILQCHNQYLFPGGEDVVAKAEAKMLEDLGHTVIKYHRSNQEIQKMSFLKKVCFFLKDIFFAKDVYHQLRALIQKEKPDIAHFHNSFFMLTPSAYQACFDEKLPVVQTLHNYRFLCPAGIFFRSGKVCQDCLHQGRIASIQHGCWHGKMQTLWMNMLIKQYEKKKILCGIQRFIVLTAFAKNKFVSCGWLQKKMTIKHNFVEASLKREKVGDYVLFVGALQEYKGVKFLLDTWQEYKIQIPLKIVGSGPLEQELKKKQISFVEFLGQKTKQDIQILMKNATCLVMPSIWYEACPMVILESKSCGVPVITTMLGAMQEMVTDEQTGLLIKPYDQKALYEAVKRLFDDKDFNQILGNNAYQEYRQKYTKEINAQQLINLYQDVINQYATI